MQIVQIFFRVSGTTITRPVFYSTLNIFLLYFILFEKKEEENTVETCKLVNCKLPYIW